MSCAVKKVAPDDKSAWYRAAWAQPHPTAIGWFEVRNSVPLHHRNKAALIGSRRWWDGASWLTEKDGRPSIFGTHGTHEFRGVRRWVLVRKADPLLTALNEGKPVDAYLASARPGLAKFNGLAGARPFKTAQAAQRFAARFSHLGLTAVLP